MTWSPSMNLISETSPASMYSIIREVLISSCSPVGTRYWRASRTPVTARMPMTQRLRRIRFT